MRCRRCAGQPFTWETIHVFGYRDVPVGFVETYTGEFDKVFARREDGRVVGFVKSLGKGQALVFGAAMAANTLGDLDIVHQMALEMGCPPLFELSDWADVRLSRGQDGSFLFVNNYQDDPVETVIRSGEETLFGGNPVRLPARRGLILPLEWRLDENVTIHSLTAEVTGISDDGATRLLTTDPAEFFAEFTLKGYTCAGGTAVRESGGSARIRLHGKDGMILLRKDTIS